MAVDNRRQIVFDIVTEIADGFGDGGKACLLSRVGY